MPLYYKPVFLDTRKRTIHLDCDAAFEDPKPCDLLVVPRPLENPPPPPIAFTSSLSRRRTASCCAAPPKSCALSELQFPSLKGLSPPAIAASRGEQPGNVEAWLEGLADSLAENDAEVEGRAVTSITP